MPTVEPVGSLCPSQRYHLARFSMSCAGVYVVELGPSVSPPVQVPYEGCELLSVYCVEVGDGERE